MTHDPIDYKPTQEKWRELARQALKEQDHEKLLMLVQQIIETYREQKPTGRTVQAGVKYHADALLRPALQNNVGEPDHANKKIYFPTTELE